MIYALLAALLFGASVPLSKELLETSSWGKVPLAGMFYLASGVALFAVRPVIRTGEPLRRPHLPWLAGAVLLGGVAAPVAFLYGVAYTTGYAASLLGNLETVFTAAIAVVLFKERLTRWEWLAAAIILAGAVVVNWETAEPTATAPRPLLGGALVALSGLCWGFDNNFTRRISTCDPLQIAGIKGLVAGAANLILGLSLGQHVSLQAKPLALAVAVGVISYGVALVLIVMALRRLGATKTFALWATSAFSGVALSWLLLKETPHPVALAGGAVMIAGVAWMALAQKPAGDSSP